MKPEVLTSVEDGLLRVTINRPEKRNPLSRAVLARLQQVFEEQRRNDGLALALVSGAGDRSFAAGGVLLGEDADIIVRAAAATTALK